METIDEIGRRAAQVARAEAEAYIDVEAGLARVTADDDVDSETSGGDRRPWVVLAAAAAVIAVAAAGVIWARQEPSSRLVPGSTPDVTPAPTPAPTPVPTTTPPATTGPAPPGGLSVSYRNPPPLLQPAVFGTLTLPDDVTVDHVAVTENGAAVVIDSASGDAIVFAPDGSNRRLPLDARIFAPVVGPGEVLFGLEAGPETNDLTLVAIALATDRAGQVVASSPPLDDSRYVELPPGALGLGPAGIIDRARQVGATLSGYVDTTGEPLEFVGPSLVTIDDDNVVRADGGSVEWPLDIERHPDSPAPFAGESPPAPTANGGAVYWTGIGSPDDPTNDFPANTINVVAILDPDGSGRWYRLPDGWSVAASDAWGTILTRRVGDQIELATLAPRGQNVPETTAAPTTVAPTTVPPTTVPPTTVAPTPDPATAVAELAEAIGASKLIAREPGRITVYADGRTTEVATPDDLYVQTDGDFLWWDIVTGETTSRSAAATLDGTVVCEVDGRIHRIREDPDGGYVASVERPNPNPVGSLVPVPNFAVDCESGDEQPIETVSWTREGGSRHIERIGDRTFTHESDAEGNADVTNESGVSINGDDYAGFHEFNDDASRVVYGDMGALATPHVTNVLRSRDTTTGEVLWTTQLARPADVSHWYGDRIVVPVLADAIPSTRYDSVVVLDALTGDVLSVEPSSLDIAFVG